MAGARAVRLLIRFEEVVVRRRHPGEQQALGDHHPDGDAEHPRQDRDHDPRIERQRREQDAEIVVTAAFDLLGRIEGEELRALPLACGGKLERGLWQRRTRDAELVDLASKALTQCHRAVWGGKHASDLARRPRSEEHTSELQSLMRISYAVFCLKKKKEAKNERHDENK